MTKKNTESAVKLEKLLEKVAKLDAKAQKDYDAKTEKIRNR